MMGNSILSYASGIRIMLEARVRKCYINGIKYVYI
jgi:hypothetical protein